MSDTTQLNDKLIRVTTDSHRILDFALWGNSAEDLAYWLEQNFEYDDILDISVIEDWEVG